MNDVGKKLEEVLSGVDLGKLKQSKGSIEKILNSPQGKNFAKNLSDDDKKKIINAFLSMDTNTLKNKLNNADISKLSNLNPNDIINKLK